MSMKELKRVFTSKQGNKVELIGAEKKDDGQYYFSVKVNGKVLDQEFTEKELLKSM